MSVSAKSSDVAIALRNLADHLDKCPDSLIPRPSVYFSATYGPAEAKDWFLNLAKTFPRPIAKSAGYRNEEVVLEHNTDNLYISSRIEKVKMCRLVHAAREAVYECEPILSAIEEEGLVA